MAIYLQHFGLKHPLLGKSTPAFFPSAELETFKKRFQWLLETPGIGVLTGEPGVGKTCALRAVCESLNPHEYRVIYHSETDFGRVDLYRQLAIDLDLEPAYRRANVWRDLKNRIQECTQTQHQLPVWIIDEAQNLPPEFFRDFSSFLNFAFDSKPLMTVWFVGHPQLDHLLKRAAYTALRSRIQVFTHISPINDSTQFKNMLAQVIQQAGCEHPLLSDSGCELLRLATQGKYRQTGQLLNTALHLAAEKGLNHLPDELLEQAIKEMQK